MKDALKVSVLSSESGDMPMVLWQTLSSGVQLDSLRVVSDMASPTNVRL